MSSEVIPCPHCGVKNRLPILTRFEDGYQCGGCHKAFSRPGKSDERVEAVEAIALPAYQVSAACRVCGELCFCDDIGAEAEISRRGTSYRCPKCETEVFEIAATSTNPDDDGESLFDDVSSSQVICESTGRTGYADDSSEQAEYLAWAENAKYERQGLPEIGWWRHLREVLLVTAAGFAIPFLLALAAGKLVTRNGEGLDPAGTTAGTFFLIGIIWYLIDLASRRGVKRLTKRDSKIILWGIPLWWVLLMIYMAPWVLVFEESIRDSDVRNALIVGILGYLATLVAIWVYCRKDGSDRAASRLRAKFFSGEPVRLRHFPQGSQAVIGSISYSSDSDLCFTVFEVPEKGAPIQPVRPNDVIQTPDGEFWRVHRVTVRRAGDSSIAEVGCSRYTDASSAVRVGRGDIGKDGTVSYGPDGEVGPWWGSSRDPVRVFDHYCKSYWQR